MSTDLKKLPPEMYEKIFKKLTTVEEKISLLEVRPVNPKLFLHSLQQFEFQYELYYALKASRLPQTTLNDIIAELLKPETINLAFKSIENHYKDDVDDY